MWNLKKAAFANLDIDLVVASRFMMDRVRRSPITSHIKNVHLIPFGIDTKIFHDRHDKAALRAKFGIHDKDVVLFFRADESPFKGLAYIKNMLKELNPSRQVSLLTVGSTGLFRGSRYKVIDMGWINDEQTVTELYAASDIFLMPSTAEAFGLMAIEAMMSGLPVIVFEGTALPDVTFAPDCGIVIKNGEASSFARTVERLITDPDERKARGQLGRKLALEHYDVEKHFARLLSLYEGILLRR
jgi:glycosyltransferase involved in cell wall biosynthesis